MFTIALFIVQTFYINLWNVDYDILFTPTIFKKELTLLQWFSLAWKKWLPYTNYKTIKKWLSSENINLNQHYWRKALYKRVTFF